MLMGRRVGKRLRRKLTRFAHSFNIHISIRNDKEMSTCFADSRIELGIKGWNKGRFTKYSTEELAWSYLIHEVIHALCYRSGKWPSFHSGFDGKKSGEAFRRTAVKAEMWVEDLSEKGLKAMFPSYKFYRSYTRSEASINWLRTHYHTIKRKQGS